MVVGETARADRFSLNGYARETNPGLKQHNVISLTDFQACGTSTAVSVPCMFLSDGEAKGAQTIRREENVLDVLRHGGVNVLWLDNNSDSKGVAERVDYRDFKNPANNPVCDTECRDEGMLVALQKYIDSNPQGDILIVLHQMGSHGPAYHRRYPPAFEKFRPACKESDLSLCTREEIGNAYDNTILYTDHFLSGAIKVLQRNDARFDTALFYVSDHGESLGENGVYLHGLPKAIAPDTQLRVPAILWFGPRFHQADPQVLRRNSALRFSHDNVFHTLLGLFEIESAAYMPEKDLLRTGTTAPALMAQGTGRR
jgi:lipid A ethanolaminephosphotransferase